MCTLLLLLLLTLVSPSQWMYHSRWLLVQVNWIVSARRLVVHGMGTRDARCIDDTQQQSYVLHYTIRPKIGTAAGAY